jgi:hypothetical protein
MKTVKFCLHTPCIADATCSQQQDACSSSYYILFLKSHIWLFFLLISLASCQSVFKRKEVVIMNKRELASFILIVIGTLYAGIVSRTMTTVEPACLIPFGLACIVLIAIAIKQGGSKP